MHTKNLTAAKRFIEEARLLVEEMQSILETKNPAVKIYIIKM